ncbi:MAG: redox-regulated ATPase YchF [bacterium]
MPGLAIGIVGLPNVGKSTLFQALTRAQVPAENYPFCTIDPNVGIVEVPDPRLRSLWERVEPRRERMVPAAMEVVDIAGLVEGASRGEGLGNQFLARIREMDAVAHIIRCFDDPEVVHPYETADPLRDREVVETELILADLEVVEGRIERITKKAVSGEKEARQELLALERLRDRLQRGEPARREEMTSSKSGRLDSCDLLTAKPVLYVANIGEEDLEGGSKRAEELASAVRASEPGAITVPLCARLEAEVAQLPEEEQSEYLEAMGLRASGLDRLIQAGYRLLGLITFFTIGDEEVRAWTVREGATAPEAAGRVHSDFQEGFIRTDAIAFEEFTSCVSFKEARAEGKLRSEGKDYVVRDGDILFFHARTP